MNPQFRKVALIAASLGLLLSLFLTLRPRDDETAAPTTTATPTTAATTTEPETTAPATTAPATTALPPPTTTAPTPPMPPAVVRIQLEVRSAQPGLVRRFSVKQGWKVAIVVRSDLTDHIHLHGYDLMADVAPGAPGTIRFTADVPGRFELELENRGLQIAELEVRP